MLSQLLSKRCRILVLSLVVSLPILHSDSSLAQNSDLYASVRQSAVDKVLNDANYPLTLVNEHWSCVTLAVDEASASSRTSLYTAAERAAILAHAQSRKLITPWETDPNSSVAQRILDGTAAFNGMIEDVKDQKRQAGSAWQGPTDAEIETIAKKGIDFKACLTWLAVDLTDKPSVSIAGSAVPIKDVKLSVGATGELWGYWPDWVCDKHCWPGNWCCWGHFENRWHLVASLTVREVKLKADATVVPFVEDLVINLRGSLDQLRLNYPILEKIPLEQFANPSLQKTSVPVLDAKKLVAAVPYIEKKYVPTSLVLSGSGEIRVDIQVQKVH